MSDPKHWALLEKKRFLSEWTEKLYKNVTPTIYVI